MTALPPLFEVWTRDAAAGLAARLVQGAGMRKQRSLADSAQLLACLRFLADLTAGEVHELSLPSLDALAKLSEPKFAELLSGFPSQSVLERAKQAAAKSVVWLQTSDEHSPPQLLGNGLALLAREGVSFAVWTNTMARATDKDTAFGKKAWTRLRMALRDDRDLAGRAEVAFSRVVDPQQLPADRLAAMDALRGEVARAMTHETARGTAVQAHTVWHKLCRHWLSGQMAWPLLALARGPGQWVGASLPVQLSWRADAGDTLLLAGDGESVEIEAWLARGDAEVHLGGLRLSHRFVEGLATAARAASDLWAQERVDCGGRWCFDFWPAVAVARCIFGPDVARRLPPLDGGSHELYLAASLVACRLPGARLPAGAASGGLALDADGRWCVTAVDAVPAKTLFAAAAAFSRLVVPVLRADDGGVDEARLLGLELNPVGTLRQAAGLLLPQAFWAQRFVRTLPLQIALANARPGRCSAFGGASPLLALPDGPTDAELAAWLAAHQQRLGRRLRLVALRREPAEAPLRLWAAAFSLMGQPADRLQAFRWGGTEQAAEALAEALQSLDLLLLIDASPQQLPDRADAGEWRDWVLPGAACAQALLVQLARQGIASEAGLPRLMWMHRGLVPTLDPVPGLPDPCLRPLQRLRHGFDLRQAAAVCDQSPEHIRPLLRAGTEQGLWQAWRDQWVWTTSPGPLSPAAGGSALEHFRAARAYSSLIAPQRSSLGLNRDDAHEAEADLEAAWHLGQAHASSLMHWTDHDWVERRRQFRARFELGRPLLGWDTSAALAASNDSEVALDLASDLIRQEVAHRLHSHVAPDSLLGWLSAFSGWVGKCPRDQLVRCMAELGPVLVDVLKQARLQAKPHQRVRLLSVAAIALRRLAGHWRTAELNPRPVLQAMEVELFTCLAAAVQGGNSLQAAAFDRAWLEWHAGDGQARQGLAASGAALAAAERDASRTVRVWVRLWALSPELLPDAEMASWTLVWARQCPAGSARRSAFVAAMAQLLNGLNRAGGSGPRHELAPQVYAAIDRLEQLVARGVEPADMASALAAAFSAVSTPLARWPCNPWQRVERAEYWFQPQHGAIVPARLTRFTEHNVSGVEGRVIEATGFRAWALVLPHHVDSRPFIQFTRGLDRGRFGFWA